ncbi:hypothetical protein D9615_005069 [Tricholomella constricta]|uniref:Protein kinase domain-containing protein n=1 Tax=Tricholomella constricta TaxID=117010 RepID=A0A8H5HH12_9AGAR|nr:hypothetical protein D9615_005069 [Tricholomella constricta]
MSPSTTKRHASRSPVGERAPKRHATSSPEEGELDDASPIRPTLPPLPSSLPPKPVITAQKPKVAFPFKKKADLSRSGSTSSVTEVKDGPVVYERSAEDEQRFAARQVDSRRKPVHSGHSDHRHPSLERRDNASSRHYAPRRDYHRDRPRSPSPRSPPSRSPGSPSSLHRLEKHRLPLLRSPTANFSPLRGGYGRDGDRDSEGAWNRDRDRRYDEDRYYSREPASTSKSDRYYRPGPYAANDYHERDYTRRDDERRGNFRRDDRGYDRDRGDRRRYDDYRPVSPPPVARSPPPLPPALPPLPGPSNSAGTPPPPACSPPPPPPPDLRLKKDATLPQRHKMVSIPLKRPAAPKDIHSPTPMALPPARNVLLMNGADKKREGKKESEMARLRPVRKREPVRRSKKEEMELYGRAFEGCGIQSDYEVTTKLGEGTFGEVHKAIHKDTGRVVALKRILMHNEKEGMPVTALREIKILKALRHSCVIEILDMFIVRSSAKDPLSVYMVFPYMDHDLAGLLENDRVKLQPSHIKLYMKQLLEGTEYMHRNNILHRDMKAANLLISNTGSLRIADFGLARAFDNNVTRTTIDGRVKERKYTNCVVTRWYRPPELLLGARQYGGEVDIWGIGCVLGEMFSRRPILPGNSDLDQLEKIWHLCGTPNQHTWPNFDALPGCEGVKRFQLHSRRIKQTYESVGYETCDLLDKLLTCNPRERITAAQALDHDYFWTDPLPADPKSLPSYEASHEFDKRGQRNLQPPPNPNPHPHPLPPYNQHNPAHNNRPPDFHSHGPGIHRNHPRNMQYPPNPHPLRHPHGPQGHAPGGSSFQPDLYLRNPNHRGQHQPRFNSGGGGRGLPPQHHINNNNNNHNHRSRGPPGRDDSWGGGGGGPRQPLPSHPSHLPQRPSAPQGLQPVEYSGMPRRGDAELPPPGGGEDKLNYD